MDGSNVEADSRPLYGPRRKRIMRALVFITAGAMLLPLLAGLYSSAARAASQACLIATVRVAPDATGYSAPFQLLGPGVIGWECYATGTFGGDRHIISLGLLPGLVTLPTGGVQT